MMFDMGAGLGRGRGSDIGNRRCREDCRVG